MSVTCYYECNVWHSSVDVWKIGAGRQMISEALCVTLEIVYIVKKQMEQHTAWVKSCFCITTTGGWGQQRELWFAVVCWSKLSLLSIMTHWYLKLLTCSCHWWNWGSAQCGVCLMCQRLVLRFCHYSAGGSFLCTIVWSGKWSVDRL